MIRSFKAFLFQFKRVKEKGFLRFFKVLFYWLLLRVYLFYDKNIEPHLTKRKTKLNVSQKGEFTNFVDVDYFIQQCDFSLSKSDYISFADEIIKGKIDVFGYQNQLNFDNLLEDPISKLSWEATTYAFNSKVEAEGFGDVKYVMQVNKMYHLIDLAKAYYLTKDDKYIISIHKFLIAWQGQVDNKSSVVNRIILDRSFRAINLIQVIFLCGKSDFFNKEVLPLVLEILNNEESRIRLFLTSIWHKLNNGANHSIGELVGLISIQLCLGFFLQEDRQSKVQSEINTLNKILERIITSAGVYLEQSGSYSKLVAEFLIYLDIILIAFCKDNLPSSYTDEYLNKIVKYLGLIKYESRVLNFGDNDGACALYSMYNFNNKDDISFITGYKVKSHFNNINYLSCNESGQFIYNTPDIMLFIRSGPHSYFPEGSSSHSHNDILSFLLGVKSRMVFIDYGTYLYNSGLLLRRRDLFTSNHNTVSFDGVEQADFKGKWGYFKYPKASILRSECTKSHICFEGVCSYKGFSHNRAIEYDLKKGLLTIEDSLKSPDNVNYTLSFLLNPIFDVRLTHKRVELLLADKPFCSLKIHTNGIIDLVKSRYSPAYGVERVSNKIEINGTLKAREKIITEIKVDD